ncbi:MAG: hypothetical protein M3347_00375, partial [Armatimonadota bacterium]|nr:hypothetical protein [Armatimonadota bacterium]
MNIKSNLIGHTTLRAGTILVLAFSVYLAGVVGAKPNAGVARQTDELVAHIEKAIDAHISPWEKGNTPLTARALRLQQQTLLEVMRAVLHETLTRPLEKKRLRALQQGLEEFATSLFTINMQTSPASRRDEEMEAQYEIVLQLWDSQGKDIMREQWRWNLRYMMEVLLRRELSTPEKAALEKQIIDLTARVEREVAKLFPQLPATKLAALAAQHQKQELARLSDPYASRSMRPVPAEQWETVVQQGLTNKENRAFVESLVQRAQRKGQQRQGVRDDDVSLTFSILWSNVATAMTIPPSPQLQASYSADLSKRRQAYTSKVFELQAQLNAQRQRLVTHVLSDVTLDREIMVWLIRAGLEMSIPKASTLKAPAPKAPAVRALTWKAEATLPLPPPPQDEYYFQKSNPKRPAAEANLFLSYAIKSPSKLRIALPARKVSSQQFDFFAYRTGMVLVLNGSKLMISAPSYQEAVTLDINRPYNWEEVGALRGAGVPLVDPFVKNVRDLLTADWRQAKPRGTQKVGDITCQVLELRYARPLKTAEPHFISATRRFRDAARDLVLREDDLDPSGRVISTTSYGEFVQPAVGKWVALRSQTTVLPGKSMCSLTLHRQTGGAGKGSKMSDQAEVLRGQVRFPGRTIHRAYW